MAFPGIESGQDNLTVQTLPGFDEIGPKRNDFHLLSLTEAKANESVTCFAPDESNNSNKPYPVLMRLNVANFKSIRHNPLSSQTIC